MLAQPPPDELLNSTGAMASLQDSTPFSLALPWLGSFPGRGGESSDEVAQNLEGATRSRVRACEMPTCACARAPCCVADSRQPLPKPPQPLYAPHPARTGRKVGWRQAGDPATAEQVGGGVKGWGGTV
jgi:hypothetical protein